MPALTKMPQEIERGVEDNLHKVGARNTSDINTRELGGKSGK